MQEGGENSGGNRNLANTDRFYEVVSRFSIHYIHNRTTDQKQLLDILSQLQDFY